jgi:Zn-dependent protease
VLLFSFVAHEYAHARTALWQGDDTAYQLGRVTLNPLPHIDPWMTILLPALLLIGTGGKWTFGGAKPVPVVSRKFRHYVRGDVIVSSAGVVTNLILAVLCAVVFLAFHAVADWAPGAAAGLATLQRMMVWGMWFNLLLCFFNLIPIPPLDGSHLLYHLLPPGWGLRFRQVGQFGFLPLLLLLYFFPGVTAFFLAPARWGMAALFALVAPYGIGTGWNPFQA